MAAARGCKRSRRPLGLGVFPLIILFPAALCFSELSFVTEPSDKMVSHSDHVVMDCLAQGETPVDIRWQKNGARLLESDRVHFLPNGSLSLSSVRRGGEQSDEGFYQCLAHNKYGAILSQRARLTISSISSFLTQPSPVVVREGSVARFACSVSASPPAIITWEFNQRALPLETERITVLPNGVLQIHEVRAEDAGVYRCVATNIANRLRSGEAMLTVNPAPGAKPLMKPQIIAGPQNISASLHQTVVLECVAEGNPRPLVSWSRADSKPIDVFGARVLGNGNLVISNVKAQHSGVYLCRATTPRTRNYTTAAANLTVLVSPSLVEKPESQTRPRAGTARFSCQAEGVPTPRITWLKNGEAIHSNGRIKMYNSKLVINQIIPEDDAIYQCQAENSQGSVLSMARLIVVMSEDRPSAPRNVHAETISSSAILLAWERPQYNADKVIAYSVHYMKAEGLNNEEYQAVIGNDTTSHIVDDLEPARNYTFYIVAYMPMGASRMSEQVTQHTLEDVPLRTPELSLTSRSPTDILVSWQPLPAKLSRGRVSAYRLSFRTASDEEVTSMELPGNGENSTQHLLQGLQPDTIYLLRLAVSTRVGWSQPSAWSSHRTPKTSSASVPPAPNLELEPLNCTSITVRWHPAPSDAVVQGYKIFYYLDGQTESSNIQFRHQDYQHTITGLDPRRKYHVKLLAFSSHGDGYQAHQIVSTPGCPSAPNRRLATLPAPDHVHGQTNSSSVVRLSWGRPAFSSGKPVSYSIRYGPVAPYNASAVRYLQTTEQTVMVQGLRPNTRYEFAVRLHMDQMSSPWSSPIYQRTLLEAPSSPPLAVRVTLIEEDTALVSWRQPEQPNLAVTHYTILYASQRAWIAGEWQVLQREASNTMALLEKLESGNVYMVKISASNQAGDGPFSNMVELPVLKGKTHQGKNPRHTYSQTDTTAFTDGLYHFDEKSMSGIIIGVCIALACIVICVFILITKTKTRKSSTSKMIGRVSGEVMQNGLPRASPHQAENAEVLVPMMENHFIDTKGGTTLMINRDGPIISSSHNKTRKWNIFRSAEKCITRNNQVVEISGFYEVGKTVLQYEEEQAVASLQPPSLQIFYRPLGESESSQASEGSRETGDSGNFSQDEAESSSPNSSPNISQPPFICLDKCGPSENAATEKHGGSSQSAKTSSCVLNICPHDST
ncbi:protogenin B isoform X2 [Astyanax mexicanus]|uniref:protogenin B isoform X2 n=1 Tax=Astyanax mexicanus TaxID=7994 RepID=UPI0020CAB5FD|nr:protogenin B isoform X2 [Astyanax mexicanus]